MQEQVGYFWSLQGEHKQGSIPQGAVAHSVTSPCPQLFLQEDGAWAGQLGQCRYHLPGALLLAGSIPRPAWVLGYPGWDG